MDVLEKYCRKLINKIYILLPTFEGRDHINKVVIYSQNEAYDNYLKNLNKLKVEIRGCASNFDHIVEFIEIYNIVEGLSEIKISEHDLLKQYVFHLIDICEKLIENKSEDFKGR